MNTNRNFRAILVIVLIAAVLSACSPQEGMKFVANAAYSEDAPASVQVLQISPRIADCNMSSHQLLINAMNAETNPKTGEVDGVTIGSWLNSKMTSYTCITK